MMEEDNLVQNNQEVLTDASQEVPTQSTTETIPLSAQEELPQHIAVKSNLVAAYMLNMFKAILLIGGLIGAYFLILNLLGEDPINGVLDIIDIPFIWVTQGVAGIMALVFIGIIFNTLSLTSYQIIFDGNNVTYSYGNFFKVTRSADITNVLRVNFREYSPSRLGDISIELTGTGDRTIKVQYVGHAARQADIINNIISARKSSSLSRIDSRGGCM